METLKCNRALPMAAQEAIADKVCEIVHEINASSKRTPHNWLDNSNFRYPVNQRRKTSYTGYGYTIDRWLETGKTTVDVITGGVKINNTSADGVSYFSQRLEPWVKEYLRGKTVTLAVWLENEGVLVASGAVVSDQDIASCTSANGTVFKVYDNTSSGNCELQVVLPASGTVTLCSIALYEGSYTLETLPPYEPKGYAAEVLECQRYFQMFAGRSIGNSISTGGNFIKHLVVPFRVTPTLKTVSLGTIYVNGSYFEVDSAEINGTSDTSVTVTAKHGSGGVPGSHAAVLSGQNYELSADL